MFLKLQFGETDVSRDTANITYFLIENNNKDFLCCMLLDR